MKNERTGVRRAFCDIAAMCANRKQTVNRLAAIVSVALTFSSAALADPPNRSAGGVSVGEGAGGVTDHAYVTAPPNYLYVVETARGTFLDCGEGAEMRATDADGRDRAPLRCGVTLTETVVIPAAASSARVIIHF
ncbi:MAG: hypothetical protein AAGD92_09280 [Pseudomonadota bacterium]